MAAVQGVSIYWTSTDQFPFLKKAFKCFALVFAASIGSISFLSLISTEDYIDIGIDEKFYEIRSRIQPYLELRQSGQHQICVAVY